MWSFTIKDSILTMRRQACLQVVELYVWKTQKRIEIRMSKKRNKKYVRNKSPERELVAKLIYKD